jgi:hypothetical protein
MNTDDDRDGLFRALRGLPRAEPGQPLAERVHRLAMAELGRPDTTAPVARGRRLVSAVAPALLAVVVASYFGWSVCFLLASRIARLG